MEIIPEKCLEFIPFTPEAITLWSGETDLLQYLRCLYDHELTVVADSGARYTSNSADHGNYLFKFGKRQVRTIATRFLKMARKAKPAPLAEGKEDPVPNFQKDKDFGLAAKYYIAWDGTVGAVLEESTFLSISHVLESRNELDCSILLASHLYYKQALQVLRNFIEGVFLQLYFCENQSEFAAWKANDYRVPRFRGRNSILDRLQSLNIISQRFASTASNLYGDLNGTVHGAEFRLTNRGIFTGEWEGQVFNAQRFAEWSRYFSECVRLSIPIMRLHVNIWQKIRSADPATIICDICHSEKDFDIEKSMFAGKEQTTMRCRKCGHSMTFDSEGLEKRTQR